MVNDEFINLNCVICAINSPISKLIHYYLIIYNLSTHNSQLIIHNS